MYRERPLVTIAKSSHSAFGQKELKIRVSILFDGVIALGKKINRKQNTMHEKKFDRLLTTKT